MKPDGCIFLRGTPHPTDPTKCYFDMWYLTLFPEGSTEYFSNSMRDWVSVDHQVEHERGKAGEVSCGPGIDQDVAIWDTQQAGLRVARLPRRVPALAGAPHPLLPRDARPLPGCRWLTRSSSTLAT